MKNLRPLLLIVFGIIFTSPVFSQVQCNLLQASNAAAGIHASSMGYWFGVIFISV